MREILFRGKMKDAGVWVYGSDVYQYGSDVYQYGCHEISLEHCEGEYEFDHYAIDPETVGQYTGLIDKNGNKIFEGDVVKAVIVRDLGGGTQNREETGIIGYDKIGMIGLIAKYVGTIPVWSDFFQELVLSGCINDYWFEVIGNIHDNPELIGGTEDGE